MSSSIKFKNPFKRFMKNKESTTPKAKETPLQVDATFNQEAVAAADKIMSGKKDQDRSSHNPYMQSINLYQSLYGGVFRSLQIARRLNKWFLAIILFLLVSVVYLGSQSKVIPYVTVIQNDNVLYGELMKPSSFERYRSQFIAYFLQKFIESSRTVSSDAGVNSANRRQAFALVKDNASEQLSGFYDHNEPNIIGATETRELTVKYLYPMPNTDNALEAGWVETIRQAKTGKVIGQRYFKGTFIYKFTKPSQNMDILRQNPFGFYITSFHWTSLQSLQGVN